MNDRIQTYETLILEEREQIATITLNRPDKRNALSRKLRDEIVGCVDDLAQNDAIKVIIFTGAGSTFCAGFDLSEFQTGDMQEIFAHATGYHHKVYNSPKPTIAAVNGQAMAGGMDLAMMCDLRICTTDAMFGQPQVKMGISAAFDLLQTIVPESIARELCLTGRKLDASEALAMGLVNQIAEADQLLEQALALATDVAASAGSITMRSSFVKNQPDLFESR